MTGLSLGLFGLSTAMLLDALTLRRAGQLSWLLAALAGLAVFIAAPAPHAEVAVWALASLLLWSIDRTDRPTGQLAAALSGYLVGDSAPWIALPLDGPLQLPHGAAEALAMALALLVGAALAGPPGALSAAITAALPLGLFADLQTGSALLGIVLLTAAGLRGQVAMISGVLLLIPLLAFLGGAR